MDLIESIILGATQGLTEFIPVSSSGHLEIIRNLLNANSDNFHLFLEFINIGTLLALLIFFRKKIWQICIDIFKNHNFKLAINILLTSIPAGLIGLALAGFIEDSSFFGAIIVVAIAMGLVGLLMIFLEKLPRAKDVKDGAHLSKTKALIIGLAQTFALIPGVSRSGATIIAGRLSGLSPSESAEYSFLASIPIFLGVTLKVFLSSSDRTYFMDNLPMLTLSNAVAFITGIFALYFVFKYLKKRQSLRIFGIYRVALSLGLLTALLI